MNSTKVLLADDHTIVVQGLQLLLKDSFNLVGTVRDGRALLEAAARLKPDVIIADISMPLLNGLDAIHHALFTLPAGGEGGIFFLELCKLPLGFFKLLDACGIFFSSQCFDFNLQLHDSPTNLIQFRGH